MLPWDDWQFWVVTGFFVTALGVLVRQVIPRAKGPACGGCAAGAAACAKPTGTSASGSLVTLGGNTTRRRPSAPSSSS